MAHVCSSGSPEPRHSEQYYATDNGDHESALVYQPQDLPELSGPGWDMLKAVISSMIAEKLKEDPPRPDEEFVKSIVSQEWNILQQSELSNLRQKFTNDLASSSVYVELEVLKSNKLIEELQSSNEAQKSQIKELQDSIAQQASRLDSLEQFRESHIDSARPGASNKQSTSTTSRPRYFKEAITELISDYERRKLKSLEDISTRQSQIYHRIVLIEKAVAGKNAIADNLKTLVAENGSSIELIMARLSEVVKNNEDLTARILELEAMSESSLRLRDQALRDQASQALLPSSVLQYLDSDQTTTWSLSGFSTYWRSLAQWMPNVVTVFRNITSSIRTLGCRSLEKSVPLILPLLQRVNAQGQIFLRNDALSTNLPEPIHDTLQLMVPLLTSWIISQFINWLLAPFVGEEVDVEIMFPSRYRQEIIRTGFR